VTIIYSCLLTLDRRTNLCWIKIILCTIQ